MGLICAEDCWPHLKACSAEDAAFRLLHDVGMLTGRIEVFFVFHLFLAVRASEDKELVWDHVEEHRICLLRTFINLTSRCPVLLLFCRTLYVFKDFFDIVLGLLLLIQLLDDLIDLMLIDELLLVLRIRICCRNVVFISAVAVFG